VICLGNILDFQGTIWPQLVDSDVLHWDGRIRH
jgi:hypothetical protein